MTTLLEPSNKKYLRGNLNRPSASGKPLTIHTREADDDTERILKAEVPKDHKVQNFRTMNISLY